VRERGKRKKEEGRRKEGGGEWHRLGRGEYNERDETNPRHLAFGAPTLRGASLWGGSEIRSYRKRLAYAA
jgi:hypothetical protein